MLAGMVAAYTAGGIALLRSLRGRRLLAAGEGTPIPNAPFAYREAEDGLCIERPPNTVVLWGMRRAVLTSSTLQINETRIPVVGYRLTRRRSANYSRIHLYAILPDGAQRTILDLRSAFSHDISGLLEVLTRRGLLVDHSHDAGSEVDVPLELRTLRERR